MPRLRLPLAAFASLRETVQKLDTITVPCYFLASVKKTLLLVAVAALYILHQDIWFWRSSHLVFGFIPIGLFYQGCFSVAAALLMWLLVTFAWPSHLEQEIEKANPGEDEAR
ncbi:MAG TPA: DUF3311 domain-containing protein [Pyrinomonadaceae bacterium]|nr:DUF3311 domain-containing protein [Pyrinomonadaceae bacterium]